MDPYHYDYKRPPLARSPTLRTDSRHSRLENSSRDVFARFVGNSQKSQDALNANENLQNPISPIICKRKAVLPAIGVSIYNCDPYTEDNNSLDNSQRPYADPPTIIVEPGGSYSSNEIHPQNELFNSSSPVKQSENNEASLSTSTADSGFTEKDLDPNIHLIETEKDGNVRGISNNSKTFEEINKLSDCNNYITLPSSDIQHDDFSECDDLEFFRELDIPKQRKKSKSRLDIGSRTESRVASRNSITVYDEEPRYGDDSMLQPVSHQSVVAEDKLLSSKCRRSSKLLDKLMLSNYNGYSMGSSLLSHAPNKGYKSFKNFSHGVSIAGQIMRPRTLPQLPPILKRQRTIEVPEVQQANQSDQPHFWERPSAPSPSLTPPSPSSPEQTEYGNSQLESGDEETIDFIDCR
ncbi:hypothetical protein PoB_000942500 [Plakobranchus ocellatus]|uniref:Uncharacterized protein n=1 Tax=Plakobranchus ocellatus TaxID=259542 RepID=A0AAV3YJL6_9GAST|nr:hypothetical protein PoB_000942500 [Plakobranchus ocellatus]